MLIDSMNFNCSRSGVIQEGDRVICINGQSTLNRTIDELIQRYLQPIDFEKKYFRVQSLTLLIQYTVADSVVPATGIFDVKLIRRSASLGINLQASINKTAGQPLLISKVIPGSVASRSGSINPGDILLAVNGIHLSSCSLSEAIQLLQSPDEDIIVLRIKKMDTYSTTPGMTIKHGSDSSALHDYPYDGLQHRHYHPHQHQQKTSYRKSFDENLINKCTKSDTHYRTVQNEDSDDRGYSNEDAKKLSDNNTSSLSSFPPSQSTRKPHQHQHYTTPLQQYPIEKLFPSESEETRKLLYKHGDRNTGSPTHQEYQHRVNHCQNVKGQRLNQEELDNVLSHCMNLKLDSSIEPDMNVVQVILRRKSPDCPWGITICGTDDAPDIPVLIDSINPGDPGGECGLIQPGDRILAINGITLHNGHTLTQAMRMLQHFPDKVILHIARKSNFSSTTNNSLSIPTSAIVTCGGISIVQNEQAANKMTGEIINKQTECLNQPPLSRKCTLVKAVATSNFSRSFDSISNSFSSNSVSNNYSDGQPIVGRTPVFNSNINNKNANNNNIKVYSSGHYCDEIKQSVQKSKTIYDSKSGAQAMDMSWIVAGNQSEKNTGKEPITSSRSISKPSTTVLSSTSGMHSEISAKPIPVENLNLKVPSNKARSQKTQSHHRCSSSSSRRVNQPTVSQQQSHLLLQSSSNDEPQITEKERSKYSQPFVQQYLDPTLGEINDDNTPQHYNDSSHYPVYPPPEHQRHPYYTNQKYARSYTDYLQMDLNFIQCSGCRKAIEKDIKYYLSRQQKSFEAPRRASSSHRKDTTRSTSDAQLVSSHFEPDFDNAQLHHHQQQQQQYAQLHYSSGNNKSTANRMVAYEPSTSHYEQQHHQLQQTPLKQHSNYAEENSQGNKGKVTSSHMLTDHHSKSDSRLDLIRSIDLSEDSSDVDKRNSLSVSYPTKQTVKSSQMPAPQNKYNCQSPALDKTVSRIKSNTLGSPMNIKTSQSQFPNSIQRSHSKKSKSNKTSIAKSLKHDHFTELNTWCTWIRLKKTSTTDSYGIGVSEGISTLGIFVSAIRPNSPADLSGKLFLYDRILMVNDTPVDNLTCSEVVNLISRSEKRLDLLIQRRITKQSQRSKHSHQNEMVEFSNKSSHSGGSGVKSGVVCTSSIDILKNFFD
uniref:PDZ domain-containing protein n=1 Tax=Trichobilharzia regenti TaxID=157069 RepID=A0AA85JSZ9_TRIRE|nr:unnamed protein product [Trichobilharzia regenti]